MTPVIAIRSQHGATLLVTLIMLVVLTLFAVTGFNLSSVNLKVIGNFQQQKAAEATVQQAIEQLMSTVTLFSAPVESYICVPGGAVNASTGGCPANEYEVKIERPRCNYTAAAKGYTKKIGELAPEDTNWDVRATYTDAVTKASTAIVQGVAVRMLAGNCPTWPY